jgi:diketogulonate reductase-like aldo/keto reductase
MLKSAVRDISSSILLNDGVKMPLFGLGLYLAEPGTPASNSVITALQNGYRLLDTAQAYENEAYVGSAVKNSGIKREDIFIVSKVRDQNHGYEATIKSVQESLKKLETNYVDLFLIHSPNGQKNVETYKALLDLKSKGLIKSAGVSNFGIQHLKGFEEANLPPPSVNQIELHPFMKKEDIVKYCRKQNVAVMGYSPLARAKKHSDTDLIRIAEQHKKTVAQVMIRWSLDKGYITIPKSTNPQRIAENCDVFDFTLTEEDHKILDQKPDDFNCGWDPTITPWQG